MDFLSRMNQALDYIENNLDAEINYKDVEKLACCSISCYQRMFAYITDMNLSGYIRRRRMTKAAYELQGSDIKVIDLALMYGYESPDSFSRAFQNIHGVLPSLARKEGVFLKAYPRISFQIAIKGEVEMNYRVEKKEAFRIVGVKRHYQAPQDDPSSVDKFWKEVFENGTYEKLKKMSKGSPEGVHGFIQVFGEEKVDYTIACITDNEPVQGMESYCIPETLWVVFELNGPVNLALADAWERIFCEWLPSSNYKYADAVDIECFPYEGNRGAEDYKFEIWLAVTK